MSGDSGKPDRWIWFPDWERMQHYSDRRPRWIKLYNLLSDDAYLSLTAADRGVLHGLAMFTSDAGNGRVRADRKSLARHLNVRRVSLDPLVRAGFIEVLASNVLAQEEREGERERRNI